jgi:hypothetical protein
VGGFSGSARCGWERVATLWGLSSGSESEGHKLLGLPYQVSKTQRMYHGLRLTYLLAKETFGLRNISSLNRAASNHATAGAICDVKIRGMAARNDRGEACEDKTGAPNAVLLSDDSHDLSKYTADLKSHLITDQELTEFFEPMWSLWPSTDMLQNATADFEVRKIRKLSAQTVTKRAARRRSVIARAFATGGSRRADVEAP